MKPVLAVIALLAVPAGAQHAHPERGVRQAEVASRSGDVMPFDLAATTHVFIKLPDGGTQRVTAKDPGNREQVRLVRGHLRDIEQQFRRGDFAGPSHIHGDAMPGLAQLKNARPREVAISYRDVTGGAELRYRSADPRLVDALHQWFDAQLSDHGADATEGHAHHH
jgi:hypothetical protein